MGKVFVLPNPCGTKYYNYCFWFVVCFHLEYLTLSEAWFKTPHISFILNLKFVESKHFSLFLRFAEKINQAGEGPGEFTFSA